MTMKRATKLFTAMSAPRKKLIEHPFTVCIEGNIGSGKTTFLNNFRQFNNTLVLEEPVELWRNVDGVNLLDLMYKDPQRYGGVFQSYVQLTRLERHSMSSHLPYKIMERSFYSGRCFLENMRRTQSIKLIEASVMDKWHEWCIANTRIDVDLIVYLRTSPRIVYERMRMRGRKEEDCVSLSYIEQIHRVYEDWLIDRTLFSVPAPIITLNADQSLDEMFVEFKKCEESIFTKKKKLTNSFV